MHKTKRLEKPAILITQADLWKDELIEQIKICKDYSKVRNKYKSKYNQPEIKDTLKKMYSGKCCYCEGDVVFVSYSEIEHFKPKSKYPELSFEWTNLNYSCEICNRTCKGEAWSEYLLDPSKDNIDEYLYFNIHTGEYEAIDDNPYGVETIKITGINREDLITKRKGIVAMLNAIAKNNNRSNLIDIIDIMIKFNNGTYITVYNTIKDYIDSSSD